MSFLWNLFNPAYLKPDAKNKYNFDNGVYEALDGLSYVMNPSVLTNADFGILGPSGLTPITQADGDGAEFSDTWQVFGAANADYTISPLAYPTGLISGDSPSTIQTESLYYIRVQVTTFNGDPFYLYQQQLNTVRKYQENVLTYSIMVRNKQNKVIKVIPEIFNFYDPSDETSYGGAAYLQPGLNQITLTINTDSLRGKTIGAGNYTEFRFVFSDLIDGTADIELYQIKCEFGKISTPLAQ